MRLITQKDNLFFLRFDFDKVLNREAAKLPEASKVNRKWTVPVSYENEVVNFAQKYRFDFTEPVYTNGQGKIYPEVKMPELTHVIPLKRTPYSYQNSGIAFILREKRVIVGDQMGLGKTMQAIAAISAAKIFPCLVICPASLKINWEREWHMWTNYRALILNDAIQNTYQLFYKSGLAQVFIVNYESLQKYFVSRMPDRANGEDLKLANIGFSRSKDFFRSVIIDESHRVKEPDTLQTKLTRGIADGKEWRLLLTGTPVVNAPKDLASQLAIAGRINEFGGYRKFIEKYGDPDLADLRELNYRLKTTCFYRRDKSEATDLPPKTRHKVYCDITTRTEYNAALADLENYLREYRNATDEQVRKSMRGEVMVRIGALKNIAARGKLKDVYEFISDTLANGEKLIVFGHLKEVLNQVKEKFPSVSVTGDDNTFQRQTAIDRFQKDPSTNLIVCSIAAAGVGITLTASSIVSFIEMGWHPAIMEQAEDRCILEGEPVLTPVGWIKIEELRKGHVVINRFGEYATIRDIWSKGCTKAITEINIVGFGKLRTTFDHLFMTDKGWVMARDLMPGDKIEMPKPIEDPKPLTEISFDGECRVNSHFINNNGKLQLNGRLIKAPERIRIDKESLFFFGYFTGDGFASIDSAKGRFLSISGHYYKKRNSIERCKKWFESIGINYSEYRAKENISEVRAYSAEWAFFFHKHFGQKAKGKQLPEFLMNLNKEQSGLLLDGLMASDGYYRKKRFEYVTASEKLASQVARIILSAGFKPTVNKNTTGHHLISYSKNETSNYSKVKSITTRAPRKINGIREKVYDITTDYTESFVIGLSVVHNCHRIGQKSNVECVYFIGRDTIDEWVYQLIDEKREMSNQVTGAKDDVEEIIIDEIINLFNQKL